MSPILGVLASGITKSKIITGAFESIASVTGSGQSTITFSSIPSTYKHLQIRTVTRGADTGAGISGMRATFNSDTSSNYTFHALRATNGTVSAIGFATGTYSFAFIDAVAPGNDELADTYGVSIIDIHDYADTTKNKTVRYFGGLNLNSTTDRIRLASVLWTNTAAISSISFDLSAGWNFKSGSTISLYGIKGA